MKEGKFVRILALVPLQRVSKQSVISRCQRKIVSAGNRQTVRSEEVPVSQRESF